MSEDLNIDADPFLNVLTDALRAGPGSAEWTEATSKLNAGGMPDADQYRALVAARENLESGKSYRSIRAGAGFTRKLEGRLNATGNPDGSATNTRLSAGYLSYFGVALVIGALALLLYHLSGSATEDLGGTFFNTAVSAKLDSPLPPGWRVIGSLPVDPVHGLAPAANASSSSYLGGGLVATNAINSADPFAIEGTFHFAHVSDGVIPQLFVADNSDFNSVPAVSNHELVWLVRGGLGRVVLPSGELVGTSTRIGDGATVVVQIRVGNSQAQVLVDGTTVWSGPSQLNDKPRYPGVRFLRKGADERDKVTVKDLKILER